MIQEIAREFARNELQPFASEWDQRGHFPKEVIIKGAQLGFGGIYVNEKYGGSNLGYFESSIIFQELSKGCIPSAAYISIHNMVNGMINRYGSEDMKSSYCPPLSSMDMLSSYCLTEPGAGSDAGSL